MTTKSETVSHFIIPELIEHWRTNVIGLNLGFLLIMMIFRFILFLANFLISFYWTWDLPISDAYQNQWRQHLIHIWHLAYKHIHIHPQTCTLKHVHTIYISTYTIQTYKKGTKINLVQLCKAFYIWTWKTEYLIQTQLTNKCS